MIKTMLVRLPLEEIEISVCDTCGEVRPYSFEHPESQLERPDVKIGDIVTISSEYGSKIVRRSLRITGLRYAKQNAFVYGHLHRPKLHELCVDLEEDLGRGTKGLTNMTYREFCLRREGDIVALQEAGVFPKPKPMFISRLFLGFPKK